MLRHLAIATAIALGSVVIAAPAFAQDASSAQTSNAAAPEAVVQQIVHDLNTQIADHRAELQNNKPKLVALINQIFLPHFDTDWASILVLGMHAREATPEQRSRFAKAFYTSLTNRYAEGLLSYSKGSVNVLPFQGELNDKYTVVKTQVTTDDKKQIAVNYVFHKTADGQWKAYDVIIEGISYITNYRNQVDAEIKKEGLDKLIADLETQGDKALQQMEQENKGNGAK
ncbi:MlaC/ttg2D family ABC transporter substrate-binding protein [Dyella caseinilytica]|uniref:ABC transporter substrate-binding protein n=1 Tax=Dyella caseinilytica TaxID=1849581 RepID=A0ABX7GR17_9GAMM|nr:ABC transporter substrate-binding protein [Dyella caseinilytica]QRN52879.1 ABC transporter substrate-binding protein [Dyella caseinilytica]GGA09462.1 organic solvent ABC transporter [Dyella caseinilytica]